MNDDRENKWAMEEFDSVDLADKRLDRRLTTICESLADSPESLISQACDDWAETKAAYRFFDNERVKADEIMRAHSLKTVARSDSHETILAIQDTSYLVYTSHAKTTGLGEISMKKGRNVDKIYSKGLVMHTCMAVTTEGLPLGILNQSIFARKPNDKTSKISRDIVPVKEKESYRWIDSLTRTERSRGNAKIVTVCDREADFYDFLSAADELGSSILVRANVDRAVNKKSRYAEKGVLKLWEFMDTVATSGTYEVEVATRSNGKHCKEREARTATLQLKFGSFELNPPRNNVRHRKGKLPDLAMHAVHVVETNPPEGVEPIEWMLLTNLPVESLDQARQMVRWYSLRWRIEMFFKVLKSGFKVLDCRLRDAKRLERYITVASIVAWRMLMLTYLARMEPELPCSRVLHECEWKALYLKVNRGKPLPEKIPSFKEAIACIAKLGGFLGRKSDGPPGMIVIWRGWKRLSDLSEMWCLNNEYNTCG